MFNESLHPGPPPPHLPAPPHPTPPPNKKKSEGRGGGRYSKHFLRFYITGRPMEIKILAFDFFQILFLFHSYTCIFIPQYLRNSTAQKGHIIKYCSTVLSPPLKRPPFWNENCCCITSFFFVKKKYFLKMFRVTPGLSNVTDDSNSTIYILIYNTSRNLNFLNIFYELPHFVIYISNVPRF